MRSPSKVSVMVIRESDGRIFAIKCFLRNGGHYDIF